MPRKTAKELYKSRADQILGVLKNHPRTSNTDLIPFLRCSYRVIQQTTTQMHKEGLIVGCGDGQGMYTRTLWSAK